MPFNEYTVVLKLAGEDVAVMHQKALSRAEAVEDAKNDIAYNLEVSPEDQEVVVVFKGHCEEVHK